MQDYCELVPSGDDILDAEVTRRFPVDDQQLHYELLQSGASGCIAAPLAEVVHVCSTPQRTLRLIGTRR